MFDTQEIKSSLTESRVADIAESLGICTRYDGGRYRIHCPGHQKRLGKPDKNDSSCIITSTGYYCFACEEQIDIFEMVQEVIGCDFRTAVKYVADECGIKEFKKEKLFPLSKREIEFLGLDYDRLRSEQELQAVLYTVLLASEKKKEAINRRINLFCSKDSPLASEVFKICEEDGYLDEKIQIALYNSYKADIVLVDSILEKIGL